MRRLVAGVIVALLLAATPAMAQAAFRGTAFDSLEANTYVIPAPASLGGTYSCDNIFKPYGSTINVTSYGKVLRATAYQLTVIAPDGTSQAQTFTGNAVSMTKASAKNGTYTYELRAFVGTWTGSPYRGTYTC